MVLALVGVPGVAGAVDLLRSVEDLPLPGGADRFDYQSLDPTSGILYIAHMGAGTLLVVDARKHGVTAELQDFPRVTGVLAVPELGRVFASVTGSVMHQALARLGAGEAEVVAIDGATLETAARMPGGRFPDGLAYAPGPAKLYVSDEFGDAVLIYDARGLSRIGRIELGGEVGNTHFDPVGSVIVSAVQTRGELAVIDPALDQVTARIPLPGCDHPHGFLIHPTERVAFVSCEGNARLLTVDLAEKTVRATDSVGAGPDVLAYDPGLARLYVAAEDGPLSVFVYKDATLTKLGEQDVGRRAHTVAVDPMTHEVFLPLEDLGGRPVLRIMTPDL